MENKYCKQCGKELLLKNFRGFWQYKIRVFCNQGCSTEFKKTVRHTDEYKEKMSNKLKGRIITWGDKIKITKQKNKKPKKIRKKVKYLRWFINELQQYRDWRDSIFTRDNFICQDCGFKGGKLCAHHIKLVKNIIVDNDILTINDAINCNELWCLNNGITLCVNCHKKQHSSKKAIKGGKARAKQIK